jgi:hypothetical protein
MLADIGANPACKQNPNGAGTALTNESQTEDDLIWPILRALGWTESLRQQNLSPKGRDDVPDGVLFESAEKKAKANGFPEEWVHPNKGTKSTTGFSYV